MEGWNYWKGKGVFIRTKHQRVYSGRVVKVEQDPNGILTWLTIIDKFHHQIQFVTSEIVEIKEEERQ